jgi:hypothetical protein
MHGELTDWIERRSLQANPERKNHERLAKMAISQANSEKNLDPNYGSHSRYRLAKESFGASSDFALRPRSKE